jgi:hypothetical protein
LLSVVEEHRAKAEGRTVRPKAIKGTRIIMLSKSFVLGEK